ncbi:uncharacterized protein G2W53_042386 [Senna tora]|uniref:Uncharacterized protein n=1 Tax=Senna tora TaxID=362788 RepID=A0A834SFB4_9FABA|nr:uncharacterized protein G2W53_042386 [Senna tora]
MDDIVVIFNIHDETVKHFFAWEGMWEVNQWAIVKDGLNQKILSVTANETYTYMHISLPSLFTGLCFTFVSFCFVPLSHAQTFTS